MNWIDLAIVIILLIYFFEGLRRGFIEQTLELVGFFVTLFLAFWGYKWFSGIVGNYIGVEGPTAQPIAFLVLWVIYQVIYSLGLQVLYPKIPTTIRSTLPDKLAGLFPALLKASIFMSVILTLLILMPVPGKLKASINESVIGSRFVAQSGQIEQYLNNIFGRDIKETLTFLTVPAQNEQIIQPDERVTLKFTVDDGSVDKKAEQEMFNKVNAERVKAGLKPLAWSEEIAAVARKHSQDMFKNGYFSHENLQGQSPFDRMEAGGVTFKVAGENIAYAATVDLAHNGLMRSPGHRANILATEFGTIGIGVIDGGSYGKMFTQNFTN